LANIAVTYSKMKDLNKALKYNLEALEMQKVLIEGIHPCIATTISNIGVVYDKMGSLLNFSKNQSGNIIYDCSI
jgi:hypothetical protein